MIAIEDTFRQYKETATFLILKFGSLENAAAAVWANKSLTDSMSDIEKDIVAFHMSNLHEKLSTKRQSDSVRVLAEIRARKNGAMNAKRKTSAV